MSFADLPVSAFLERVAARLPAPGGGAVAAQTVAAAAALVAMAARFSDDAFADVAAEADGLRQAASALADDDAAAYGAVLEANRLPQDRPDRRVRVAEALGRASDVPLAVAEAARHVAALGARLVADGNPALRGDAATAVLLADAAGRSAAQLVAINVRLGGLNGTRLERSAAACAGLAEAVRAAEDAL